MNKRNIVILRMIPNNIFVSERRLEYQFLRWLTRSNDVYVPVESPYFGRRPKWRQPTERRGGTATSTAQGWQVRAIIGFVIKLVYVDDLYN